MKALFLIVLILFTATLHAQDSGLIKKLTVETSSEKSENGAFTFGWSKEYDRFGNLILYLLSKPNSPVVTNRIIYRYDSLNRILQIQPIHVHSFGEKMGMALNYRYAGDTVIECRLARSNDTIIWCDQSIKKYNRKGDIESKKVLSDNPFPDWYLQKSYERHLYSYDSLDRILIDTNIYAYPDYKISYYSYSENERTIETHEYLTEIDSLPPQENPVYLVLYYSYHANDSVASLERYNYSTLTKKRVKVSRFFQYDSLGNLTDYYFIEHSDSNKKKQRVKYYYTYNERGQILTMIHHKLYPKSKKSKTFHRYNYEYW